MDYFRLLLLVALISLQWRMQRPWLSAALYGAAWLAIARPVVWQDWALRVIIAWGYFWLLHRFEEKKLVFWLILLGGVFSGLV